jgi:hypothetical protein
VAELTQHAQVVAHGPALDDLPFAKRNICIAEA